jgi:hypothetical protein
LGSAVFGAAAATGCSGGAGDSSRPAIASLSEGLNVLDASDHTWGFHAAYVKAGHVVYFSSRVGVQRPEVYRQAWPEDPANEMDARFVDEKGETFILRVGGDTLVDPTWAQDMKAGHAATPVSDPTLRTLSFQLADEMATVMKNELGKKVPAEFVHHVFQGESLGHVKLPQIDPAELESRAHMFKTQLGDVPYTTNGDWNQWYVQQYSGTVIYIPFYPSGCSQLPSPMGGCGSQQESWHTAERFWNYQWNNGSPYWSMYVDACNHGRCAWDGLTYATARWGNAGWIWNNESDTMWLQSPNQDVTGTGIGGACQTSYSWNSGGGSHLCNDDSAFEIWQMDNAGNTNNGTYHAWSQATWNYSYTSYYTFSCTTNDSTARYACDCANCYRDWLPPCPF